MLLAWKKKEANSNLIICQTALLINTWAAADLVYLHIIRLNVIKKGQRRERKKSGMKEGMSGRRGGWKEFFKTWPLRPVVALGLGAFLGFTIFWCFFFVNFPSRYLWFNCLAIFSHCYCNFLSIKKYLYYSCLFFLVFVIRRDLCACLLIQFNPVLIVRPTLYGDVNVFPGFAGSVLQWFCPKLCEQHLFKM